MKMAWVWMGGVGVAALLAGCAGHQASPPPEQTWVMPPQLPLPPPQPQPQSSETEPPEAPTLPRAFAVGDEETLVTWRCMPAHDLIAAFPADRVRLWSKRGYYELPRVAAEEGDKYQRDDVTFWNKGGEALIGNDGRQGQCRVDSERRLRHDAGARGRFQARGAAPRWTLTLADDAPQAIIALGETAQDGEIELRYDVRLNRDGHEARFIATGSSAQHDMRVEIAAGACFDRVNGEPYPARVTLMLDGERYEGCGEATR